MRRLTTLAFGSLRAPRRLLSCRSVAAVAAALLASPPAVAQDAPTQLGLVVFSGRVVDALGGFPLDGVVGEQASVVLQHCNDGVCAFVDQTAAGPGGVFRLTLDAGPDSGGPGFFVLVARARDYQEAFASAVRVAESEIDIGDLALTPPAVTVTDLRACDAVPRAGGTCAYSVRVRNNTEEPLVATALSRVHFGVTTFEVGSTTDTETVERPQVTIPPRGSQEVAFAFEVPAAVSDGRQLCADLYLGYDPFPIFTPARGDRSLFCITKGQ